MFEWTRYLFDLLREQFRTQVTKEYQQGFYVGTIVEDGVVFEDEEIAMPKYWRAAKALRYPMLMAQVRKCATPEALEVVLEDWERQLYYDVPRKALIKELLHQLAQDSATPLMRTEIRTLIYVIMKDFGEGRTMGPRPKDRRDSKARHWAADQAYSDDDFPSKKRHRERLEEDSAFDQPSMVGPEAQLDDEAGPDLQYEAAMERAAAYKKYREIQCRRLARLHGLTWVRPPKLNHHQPPAGWTKSDWYRAVTWKTLLDEDVGEPDVKQYFALVHNMELGVPVPLKYLMTDERWAKRVCRCHQCRRGRILRRMRNVQVHHVRPEGVSEEVHEQSLGYVGLDTHHVQPDTEWEYNDFSSGVIHYPGLSYELGKGWFAR